VGDHAPEPPDDYLDEEPERPQRACLRHMLGSAVWDRYEALRAYDPVARGGEDERLLYPLGVACAALQYVVGLAAGCAGEGVKGVAAVLSALESHLVVLHHARGAALALEPFAGVPPVAALRDRLRALADEAQADVPAHWEALAGEPFRQALARVVAAIGAC
jgi:hypothetical protein